jgi:hypothetical protein
MRLGPCVGRHSVISRNGEWRMRLMSDWQTVVGVTRLYREAENGEWRMRLSRNSSPFSIPPSPFFARN